MRKLLILHNKLLEFDLWHCCHSVAGECADGQ